MVSDLSYYIVVFVLFMGHLSTLDDSLWKITTNKWLCAVVDRDGTSKEALTITFPIRHRSDAAYNVATSI